MSCYQSVEAPFTPVSWALDDDQLGLRSAAKQFACERLEPLLGRSPDPSLWRETVGLAATLELATMIMPEQMGGIGINRHDLALVVEQFAAGPLERAAELTLSIPALMTLREYDALDQLPHRDIQHYLDGSTSIASCIPDVDASGLWILRQHSGSPAMTVRIDDERPRLVLDTLRTGQDTGRHRSVVALGALSIERYTVVPSVDTLDTPLQVVPRDPGRVVRHPVVQWLVDTAIYLTALLSGAVQQSVNFALTYSMARQTFRKPIAAHQLVAARLADMLISAHTIHLLLRSVTAQDPQAQITPVSHMACHVATEAMDVARELVQLCGGFGYVEGLPPAARFQTVHWFAMLLMKVEAALSALHGSMGQSASGEPA
ncbi:acyl-CoA/acyl-ACP dehydrogenase [Paraburkholderia tropica]|uniref:acyl-CoA dehydrogenase family protein n=1 Tax=Paraburkholderia tropica TaxID=92647 RepID=UPI001600086A|nr:acyl-CoA dehydrogenase family protein [Paraburkholderia tropica]QNB16127.1 acyl-CoA/acyl-ACP dehydrogenase [Paraburkholderia tropica]